jgi:hypothetical protein
VAPGALLPDTPQGKEIVHFKVRDRNGASSAALIRRGSAAPD